MPCHKVQMISGWFLKHDSEISVLTWPLRALDIHPTEHLWDVMKWESHIKAVQSTNPQQLCDIV